MNLVFTLSMPNKSSWNGKWSGAGNYYAVVRSVGSAKKAVEKYEPIVGKAFYYHFGDGWGASVSVRMAEKGEVRKIRAKSRGFWGYDWMVDEIMQHGRILKLEERQGKAA